MNRNNFVISVNGLAAGETKFSAKADKEFFAKFENCEVLDAGLDVDVNVVKTVSAVDLDVEIKGSITVACDRCSNPVAMPVATSGRFRLRPGGSSAPLEDSQEEVFLDEGSDELDLSQEIYDYSLLALPLKRIHKEGECDKVALDYLSKGSPDESDAPVDSPFSNLANMLNK